MKYTCNIVLLLLLCFLSISCIQAERKKKSNPNPEGTDEIVKYLEKRVNKLVKKHHLPSLAVVLVKGENIIYKSATGMADIDKQVILTENTYFKVWSIAKVFTALEIFREFEEGLIDIDRPITDYLIDFKIKTLYDEEGTITIRNILAHRSGLPRNECVLVNGSPNAQRSLEKFELACHDCYLAFLPETRYKYSNLGYDLLGRVVEEVRGEGYSSFMVNNFLPLTGMSESAFASESISASENIATGYEYYKGKYYPIDQSKNINSIPSGNLYTTLNDLQSFLMKMLSTDGIFQREETLNMMFQDHYSGPEDPEKMGLGWKTARIDDNYMMVWHDGGPDDGTGALIALVPEKKIGLAIISNSTAFGGNLSAPLAVDIFTEMLKQEEVVSTNSRKTRSRTIYQQEDLKELAGKYAAFGQIYQENIRSIKDCPGIKPESYGMENTP